MYNVYRDSMDGSPEVVFSSESYEDAYDVLKDCYSNEYPYWIEFEEEVK